MNEIKVIEGGVTAAKGFKAAGAYAEIGKNAEKGDLALVYSEVPGNAAAVYTKNKVKAAHIAVTKDHLQDGVAQAIICNSGNANTCTPNGVEIAQKETELVAEALGIKAADVLPAATGVIGVPLEIAPFENTIPELAEKLSKELVQKALSDEILDSYNQVSVDGDTSTNDTVVVIANGLAGNEEITEPGDDYKKFCDALHIVAVDLSQKIAGDGEGCEKLLEAHVTGAPDKDGARKVAKSVICSSLFKAAVFASDANWARILCAIGYADCDFDASNIDVSVCSAAGTVEVCKGSASVPFDDDFATKVMSEKKVTVEIDLHDGEEEAYAWGCDLTYKYVEINGSYRS